MQYRRAESFKTDFTGLPDKVKEKAKRAFDLFKEDHNHPSLKIHLLQKFKKQGIRAGHITDKYVFTFTIEKDSGETIYKFRRIGDHGIYADP